MRKKKKIYNLVEIMAKLAKLAAIYFAKLVILSLPFLFLTIFM